MDTLFSDVFQQAAAGIAIVNLDGTFRHVNQKFCSIVGYTEEELKQLTFADITHPDDLHLDNAHIVKVLAGEIDAFQIEKRYIHKDGHPVWIDLHSNVKRAADGQIEYAIATIVDITDKKQTELRQQNEQQRFQYMFEKNPAGIMLLEVIGSRADGTDNVRIKAVNSKLTRLYPLQVEMIVGKTLSEVFPELREMHIYSVVLDVYESQQPVQLPTSLLTYQDLHLWFEAVISPLPTGEVMVVVTDVTAQVEARHELLAERDRVQQYFDIAGVMLLALDDKGNIASINQHGAHVLGGTKNELIGRNWFRNFIRREDREEMEQYFHEKVLTGDMQFHHRREHPIRTLTGEERYIIWTNAFLRDDTGNIYGSLSSGEDVTDQRKLIQELQLINKVIENSLNAFGIIDRSHRFTYVNQAYVDLWGYDSAEEILGTTPAQYLADPGEAIKNIELLNQQGSLTCEMKAKRKDGSTFEILSSMWLDHDEQGNPIYPATTIDITAQKQSRVELERSREQLRQLANYIQNAREAERQHLSREMHDQFGQILSGLRMDINWLQKHPEETEKIESRLHGMEELVDQAIKITRQIASDLRPGILDDLGLFAALEWFAEEFEKRSGIRVILTLPEDEPRLQPEVVTALFRIFQEALTNVYRHAHASRIKAVLATDPQMISLSIQDNGKGIAPEDQHRSDSFGVLGMHERANILGGSVEITSQPGDGTRILVSIPKETNLPSLGAA